MRKLIRRMVIVENEQKTILVDRKSLDFMVCPQCKSESLMLQPEKITEATDIPIREIYRLIESKQVHFIEREKIFICLESLLKQEK